MSTNSHVLCVIGYSVPKVTCNVISGWFIIAALLFCNNVDKHHSLDNFVTFSLRNYHFK